jgi:hypothetical protein
MEPNVRRTKMMAKKSALNTEKTEVQAEKKIPAVPASHSTNWRDAEELVDYEPESPPSFSPAVEEFSEPEDRLRTPVPGQADSSSPEYEFSGKAAEKHPWRGRNAAEIFGSPMTKTKVSKTNRQPFLGRAVSPLFLLRRTKVWQPYRGSPRGEVSPPLTKTNWQPLLGRVVSPSFLVCETKIWQLCPPGSYTRL